MHSRNQIEAQHKMIVLTSMHKTQLHFTPLYFNWKSIRLHVIDIKQSEFLVNTSKVKVVLVGL